MRTGNLVLGTLLVLMAMGAMTWSVEACDRTVQMGKDRLPTTVESGCRQVRPADALGLPLLGLAGVSLALVPLAPKENFMGSRIRATYSIEGSPLMVATLRRIPALHNR